MVSEEKVMNTGINDPKVLIIGETFRLDGGGGITLMNLFQGWDPLCLAVATDRFSQTTPQFNCNQYYRIGDEEIKIVFPFNYINKLPHSGVAALPNNANAKNELAASKKVKITLKYRIEILYYQILTFLGIIHSSYGIKVSKSLLNWVNEFNPDVIYAQAFCLKDMQLAIQLKETTNLPMVVHIMDDSVSYLNKPNILSRFWETYISNTFRKLIDKAELNLSISDQMSAEYYTRYGRHFIPFRNPIDSNEWRPFIKSNWAFSDEIKIIYTGRLAEPNIHSLFTFSQAIENIRNSGINITLHIFSIDNAEAFSRKTDKMTSIVYHQPVKPSEIPELLSKFDLALLPLDFTTRGIRYARFSISTKTSEYMISGVPVVLFAPQNVALTSYAVKHNCMYSVSDNHVDILVSSIKNLLSNEKLRAEIANNAIQQAMKDADANNVRAEFKKAIRSVLVS